ncbi:Transcriptional regulator, TetR family [Corynebacterium kalinowskii]|uniref:Transcriptional regulator, TetR family n=1 Tax=Corynebacterium kalinowskii TaxID=2675216 RepID=A0A6B8VTE4_9CORY|nr:TetR/AcrR family transcriptional regulator [Corynebacterium kalinowskii]QGU02867.1 Transcriptional regulator, TetR family [Corynebacterium kalinowskii]
MSATRVRSKTDIDAAILAAAKESVLTHGISKTTMSGIARLAGISRPSLYARYRNVDGIITKVVTRELLQLLRQPRAIPTTGLDLVTFIVDCTKAASENQLLKIFIEHDPGLIHTYLFQRFGESQIRIIGIVERSIEYIQSIDPTMTKRGPRELAVTVLLTAQQFALASHIVQPIYGEAHPWEAELSALLKGYLLS